MAEALARRFGRQRVLFDTFHEAELARPDLDLYLPRLYRDDTELIVIVISPDYLRKRWCGLEWRWIRQLILSADQGRIMLLRLGDPGDLSDLGILQGDGFLNVADLPPEAISARILDRLAQQGVVIPEVIPQVTTALNPGAEAERPLAPKPQPLEPQPRSLETTRTPSPLTVSPRWRPRPAGLGLVAAAALVFPLAWWLGRPQLAQWHLRQGDRAFRLYAELSSDDPSGERWLQQAAQAWGQASQLDPGLDPAQGRLGFLADFLGDLTAAENHWRRALEIGRASPDTPAFKSYRTGLALVLAQQPSRRQKALEIFAADVSHPRSAIELAFLSWPQPAALPQALEAIRHSDLATALAAPAVNAEPPWGFKMPDGAVLLFLSRREQRCLLTAVQATTARLAAADSDPSAAATPMTSPRSPTPPLGLAPLASTDCKGIELSVRELLCHRLEPARAQPRSAATRRWLGCHTSPH